MASRNMISFRCPHCGKPVEFTVDAYGYHVFCPLCDGEIVVPEKGAPAPKIAPVGETFGVADGGDDDTEKELWSGSPAARNYLGSLLFGALLAVSSAVVSMAPKLDKPVLAIAIVCFAMGCILLLAVWLKTVSVRYRLTTQRLFVERGLIARRIDELELFRIKDAVLQQTVLDRLLNVGTVVVSSSDENTPEIILDGILDAMNVKEALRKAYRAARRREGVRVTEFIPGESPQQQFPGMGMDS